MSDLTEEEIRALTSSDIPTFVMYPPGWEVTDSGIYSEGTSEYFLIVLKKRHTSEIASWPLCPGCLCSVVIANGVAIMTVKIPVEEFPDYES